MGIQKKPDKILVVYSEKLSGKHLMAVEKAKKILAGKHCDYVKACDLNDKHFDNKDLVITLGGDGTFIRAARFMKEQIILGINSEPEASEGALTSINEEEIDFLKEALNGNYHLAERQRMKIMLNGKFLDELALNEVYIGTESQFHTSRYLIRHNNQEEEHRSSGVLVVTGSGSTAWYKSAGGMPFGFNEKKLAFLVREPFLGRVFKPKLLHGEIERGNKIEFKSTRLNGGVIALDANTSYNFNKGDKVSVEISENPLKVAVK